MKIRIFASAAALVLSAVSFLLAETPDINSAVKKLDQLYRSKTSYAFLKMEINTPNWSRGTRETFIRILN